MKISEAAIKVLDQLSSVIVQIDDSKYHLPISQLGNSSLGEHIRHTLEFFVCLQEGALLGKVNYDNRERDFELETNNQVAISTIAKIKKQILAVGEDLPLTLEVDYGLERANQTEIQTSFYRELAYNIEHAVHHMAILKIGLVVVAPEVKIPDGFGIAVSTLRYRREQIHQT